LGLGVGSRVTPIDIHDIQISVGQMGDEFLLVC
jgi:hypothetical protein